MEEELDMPKLRMRPGLYNSSALGWGRKQYFAPEAFANPRREGDRELSTRMISKSTHDCQIIESRTGVILFLSHSPYDGIIILTFGLINLIFKYSKKWGCICNAVSATSLNL